MKKNSSINHNPQNADESIVLWVLVFIFLALTTLTVNSYSDVEPQTNPLTVTPEVVLPEQNSTRIELINADFTSQIETKTLKM